MVAPEPPGVAGVSSGPSHSPLASCQMAPLGVHSPCLISGLRESPLLSPMLLPPGAL